VLWPVPFFYLNPHLGTETAVLNPQSIPRRSTFIVTQQGRAPLMVKGFRAALEKAQDLVKGDFSKQVGVYTSPPSGGSLYWHFGKDHDPAWHEDPLRDLFAGGS
jgi:hypothetical protein